MENIFGTGPEAVSLEWILHLSLKIWRWKYFLKSSEAVCHDQTVYSLQAVLYYWVDLFKEGRQEHPWNHCGCIMPGVYGTKAQTRCTALKNEKYMTRCTALKTEKYMTRCTALKTEKYMSDLALLNEADAYKAIFLLQLSFKQIPFFLLQILGFEQNQIAVFFASYIMLLMHSFIYVYKCH